ncbi:MAG TPA: helix-turn-helix transcriptional regulator [Beijerinckia sp.]|jgi:DNA-binding CsgD family transcriptional regulator|nr:helix-turn-helix transcriptional regulator [Beijerinckia sp.]
MLSDEKFLALIELLYEATLDACLWPKAMEDLAEALSAAQVSAGMVDPANGFFVGRAPRLDPEALRSYRDYWSKHDPLWRSAPKIASGTVFALDSVVPSKEYMALPVFQEWRQPNGFGGARLGANLLSDGTALASMAVYKRQGEIFSAEETRFFEAVAPHLARSVRIYRHLQSDDLRQEMTLQDKVAQAVFLVDATGRIIFANKAAHALIDSRDGLAVRDGCLVAGQESDRLAALIASCGRKILTPSGMGGALQIWRGADRACLDVLVIPLKINEKQADVAWLGLLRPIAMVTVKDPDTTQREQEQALRQRYNMTKAEAQLALELAKGHGRRAAAQRRGVSVATVRGQLSSIFEKTGTHRQTELIRLLVGEKIVLTDE